MTVIIEIDAPQLLRNLVSKLQAADCLAVPISRDACRVLHRRAETVKEAMDELSFFAKSWAGAHGGVAVHLRPGE